MKVFQAALISLFLLTAMPIYAAQENQKPAGDAAAVKMNQEIAAATMQENPDTMDSATMQMKDTRMKMQAATNPAERKSLMHTHMQQMHEGMKMMDMMSGENADKMPMGGNETQNKPMTGQEMKMAPKDGHDMSKMGADGCMKMNKEKMAMREKMMGSCDMMGDVATMKKKISMITEMMNGIIAQQEMMMK
ncbi:hypothetical protein FCL47_21180 [Desulfopila sp. IMCC35006]|uniref:hypothetical protein n=1 Tax=Desulfopila sp. IMCC35006 TaxID=2569542 RepID=UPI0010ABD91C|nr:hypothetical protein [Desulfopila sp. IMCC35006]TKB23707.1 hypothetical protein FCL47_21180 [Desulfopila sp. IMCC35006]